MESQYSDALEANLITDDAGTVKAITHFDKPFLGKGVSAQMVAENYIKQMCKPLGISDNSLNSMSLSVDADPSKSENELRFESEKLLFDNSTVSYQQTALGYPVWGASVTVQIKHEPYRVLNSSSTIFESIDIKEPSATALKRYETVSLKELKQWLKSANETEKLPEEMRVNGAKIFVYKFDANNRVVVHNHEEESFCNHKNEFTLPTIDKKIKDGGFYVVSEVKFETGSKEYPTPYVALIEIETNSILYLRSLSSELTGLVFNADPITLTGISANSPSSSNATLNPLRSAVNLQGLIAPVGGNQNLTGNFVRITEIESPVINSPVLPVASNFNFNTRTDEFSAVNAYYHNDRFFRFVTNLGFPASYWGTTVFPLPVDHRGLGNVLNAHCVGNPSGGIGHACYALADTSNIVNPIGIAADWRVVLHELGGHGILYCHVNSPNFGFAHSAGDSFAAILNDPDSNAPDKFATFPWLLPNRRHDRSVATGWAWGGANDLNGYASEQILSTTLFRIYQSIGGGSSDVNMKKFAANFTLYLLLRAIGNLTPSHATQTGVGLAKVTAFANELMSANLGDWTTMGHAGGAYGKVIRWAFEKQGLYQPAGTPAPFTTEGAPPLVDVYINDGRNGEYQYQPVHWANQNVWNRRLADGVATHEEPIVGVTNYAYVKIKNRGTQTATGIVVKGYHANPGVGLNWPADWQAMTTTQLAAPNLAGNNASEIVVGPFAWIPQNIGHECMLMIVSATGDPSNIVNFSAGESIPEWRLVPNDNNIAQRNVAPIAGGGGLANLLASLHKRIFYIRNPFKEKAKVTFEVKLPKPLLRRQVSLTIAEARENTIGLGENEKIPVTILMNVGIKEDFKIEEFEKDFMINIVVKANGITIGGMSYEINPKIKEPTGFGGKRGKNLNTSLATTIDDSIEHIILNENLSNLTVKKITIKKINVDIEFEE
jgi:zinc metalloprotease ZmpB